MMDTETYLRFISSLVAVLGLILAVAWAVKRWGVGLLAAGPRAKGATRRLGLLESLQLDPKHRLMLVRRDDRTHLLLLGPAGGLVVESDCAQPRFELPAQPVPGGTP
jgi:flagellar protein FliO/FliZ